MSKVIKTFIVTIVQADGVPVEVVQTGFEPGLAAAQVRHDINAGAALMDRRITSLIRPVSVYVEGPVLRFEVREDPNPVGSRL